MNKICTNPKNYKLTQGKSYEILDEEDGYFLLVNDSNKTVRYYSDLFDDVEEAQPVAPPPPPARTEADVISSLTVTYGHDRCIVNYVDLNNQVINFTTATVGTSSTNISCGIYQLHNINAIMESIDENVDTDEEDLLELRKEIVKKVISLFIRNKRGNTRWMMMSTNNDSNFEDYFEVFDSLAQTNLGWENNPNSGNEIKLWVFNSPSF